jgi:hypothetical protein
MFARQKRHRHGGRSRLRLLAAILPVVFVLAAVAPAAHAEEAKVVVSFTCKTIKFDFSGFPNLPKNTVTMRIRVDGVITQKATYSFDGPTGSYTFKIILSPGHHGLDGKADWNTNGVKGASDQFLPRGINCGAEPEFETHKLQRLVGGSETYTESQLATKPGEGGTVQYEIVVFNSGNVPLTLSNFTDPKCDEGTISGGPGEAPLASGASTTYFCEHVLTKADEEAGSYTNSASVTGTPPEGDGPPITEETNTVEVVLPPPEPAYTIEKLQKLEPLETKPKIPGSGPYTTATLPLGHVGQTVAYEVVVKNTGNVPLTFSNFTDPKCDEGTITGGPGESQVAPGGSTTYLCKHVLTLADREAGVYTNAATDTGTPPEGEGEPSTQTSNTVIVELPNPTGTVAFSCKSIVVTFSGFPNVNNNFIRFLQIKVDGVIVLKTTFTFNGPTGTFIYPLNLSPGHHSLDVRANWSTNQFKGGFDRPTPRGIDCPAEPNLSLQKLQRIAGSESFTTSPVAGAVGQEVEYEIVAKNTGNVPLTLSNFTDTGCDEGTLSGGPGESQVPSEASTTYFCRHTLTEADRESGSYSNSASVTGTPPEGKGEPVTQSSNTVVVEPIT